MWFSHHIEWQRRLDKEFEEQIEIERTAEKALREKVRKEIVEKRK